jgi:hypothetical protein
LQQNPYICREHFSKIHLALPAGFAGLNTGHFLKGHRVFASLLHASKVFFTSNIKYKFIDFKMPILNLFLFSWLDKGVKSSKDYHQVLFAT